MSQATSPRRGGLPSELAEDAKFNESQAGGVALVTTELATNLLKHASSGEIVVRPIVERGIAGWNYSSRQRLGNRECC